PYAPPAAFARTDPRLGRLLPRPYRPLAALRFRAGGLGRRAAVVGRHPRPHPGVARAAGRLPPRAASRSTPRQTERARAADADDRAGPAVGGRPRAPNRPAARGGGGAGGRGAGRKLGRD